MGAVAVGDEGDAGKGKGMFWDRVKVVVDEYVMLEERLRERKLNLML